MRCCVSTCPAPSPSLSQTQSLPPPPPPPPPLLSLPLLTHFLNGTLALGDGQLAEETKERVKNQEVGALWVDTPLKPQVMVGDEPAADQQS